MPVVTVSLNVNAKTHEVAAYADEPLLWVLRDRLGLTGSKYGCGTGDCGACSVLINGQRRKSCVVPVSNLAASDRIVTIEGLGRRGKLTRLQRAFVDKSGFACGFCTPGMVITATALLEANPRPSRAQIVRAMDGNICRCCCYPSIIESIQAASRRGGS